MRPCVCFTRRREKNRRKKGGKVISRVIWSTCLAVVACVASPFSAGRHGYGIVFVWVSLSHVEVRLAHSRVRVRNLKLSKARVFKSARPRSDNGDGLWKVSVLESLSIYYFLSEWNAFFDSELSDLYCFCCIIWKMAIEFCLYSFFINIIYRTCMCLL